jgi:hypothetical protein
MASNDFAAVFDKQIAKHLLLSYEEWDSVISDIYHVNTMDGPFEEHFSWAGYDLPTFRLPGEPITQSEVHQNFGKRYTARSFGNGDAIPMEHIEDDPTGILTVGGARIAGGLSNSFKQLVEIDAANYLINGFTVTAGTPDGASLFSLSHPRSAALLGTLDANRPTAGEDLSVAALEAMITRLRTQVSPNGVPMMNEPRILWHSPALTFQVDTILNSTQRSGTANNDTNSIKRKYNIVPVEIPYLLESGVASDAWGLIARKHFMHFMWRQRAKGRNDIDPVTNSMLTMWTQRHDLGHSDYRGTDASPGA